MPGRRQSSPNSTHLDLANEIVPRDRVVVSFEDAVKQGPSYNPVVTAKADDVAFLLYTSGSTGRPRGVMQTHRHAMHNALTNSSVLEICTDDRIALLASLNGGVGATSCWFALLNGACLFPFPIMEKGVAGLTEWLARHEITIFISTVSLFRHFMRTVDAAQQFLPMRAVRITSEPATADEFRAFQTHLPQKCMFIHTYGSTETGTIAYLRLAGDDAVSEGRLPLGRIADGMEVELIGDDGHRVAAGEVGEVIVRSRGIAAGYWRGSALSDGRFFKDRDGSSVQGFRTGDLARFNSSGLLEFAGRRDNWIKVRGNQVDLNEVEDVLRRVAIVDQATCLDVAHAGEDVDLVAFIVPSAGHSPSSREMRRALRQVLPAFMLPTIFVFVESIPLTPRGKIDRKKLLQAMPVMQRTVSSEPPQTATEIELARLWTEVFELPGIGRHDDFFDLGGDLLDAAVVAAGVYAALGFELRLGAFAVHPTLAELAAFIDAHRLHVDETMPALVSVPRDQPLPMTWTQRHNWDESRIEGAAPRHTVAKHCRIVGDLNVELLRRSMTTLVARHEILRTTFDMVGGHRVQIVHPAMPMELTYRDLANSDAPEAEAERLFTQESACVFDTEKLPLVRFVLLRVRAGEHWLLRINHHIVCDAWSWSIFFRELAQLYERHLNGGHTPVCPTQPIQYGDYAVWQQRVLSAGSPRYQTALAWWRARFADRPQPLMLPFRHPATRTNSPSDGVVEWGISAESSSRLDDIAKREHATFFTCNLAIFAALLADEIGRRDVIVGTNYTNRRLVELQDMLGDFGSLAVLRLKYRSDIPLRAWLAEVRDCVAETEVHAELPYALLRQQLTSSACIPDLTCLFMQSQTRQKEQFGGLDLTWAERRTAVMPWGFAVECASGTAGYRFHARFNADLYRPSDVRKFIDRYRRLLEAVSSYPDRTVGELLSMTRAGGWVGRLWQSVQGRPFQS